MIQLATSSLTHACMVAHCVEDLATSAVQWLQSWELYCIAKEDSESAFICSCHMYCAGLIL